MKIVKVTWEDPTFYSGHYAKEVVEKLKIEVIETLGFLIKDTDKYLIVSCSINKTQDTFTDVYQIPKACIIKKEEVKNEKRSKRIKKNN